MAHAPEYRAGGILVDVFAVLLTGPPGSGKTVALTALLDALAADGVPHAGVDVDEVSWSFPFPDLSQRCEHLRAWRDSHTRAGSTLLVVAEVIESPAHLADVLAVLGADDYLLARLHANPATMRERIIAREPDGWFGLEYLLEEMQRLHATMPSLEGVHLVLDTEHLTVPQITESIRAERADVLGPTHDHVGVIKPPSAEDESVSPVQRSVRRARPDDVEPVIAVDDLALGNEQRRRSLKSAVELGRCLVVESAGGVVGFVITTPLAFFGRDLIELLIVDLRARRRGLGRELLRAAITSAGTERVFISTNRSNTPMRELLDGEGWVLSGELHGVDEGDPEVVYFTDRSAV